MWVKEIEVLIDEGDSSVGIYELWVYITLADPVKLENLEDEVLDIINEFNNLEDNFSFEGRKFEVWSYDCKEFKAKFGKSLKSTYWIQEQVIF